MNDLHQVPVSGPIPFFLQGAIRGALEMLPGDKILTWPGTQCSGIQGQAIRATINHIVEGLDFEHAEAKAAYETKNRYLAAALLEPSVSGPLLNMLVDTPFLEAMQRYLETDLPATHNVECVLGEVDGAPDSLAQIVNERLLSSLLIALILRHGEAVFFNTELRETGGRELVIFTDKGEVRARVSPLVTAEEPSALPPPPPTAVPVPDSAPAEPPPELSEPHPAWLPRRP